MLEVPEEFYLTQSSSADRGAMVALVELDLLDCNFDIGRFIERLTAAHC
jgi:hypothetical protein